MNDSMIVTFPGGKKVYADYNGFEIATDQHPDSGGEGSAPEPYDLFLASLATCAGIYVLGFCQSRNLPTEDVRIVQSWERDPDTRRMETFRIRVETPEDFPQKYLKVLKRAVNQCSVKKTILDPPEFVVEAVRG
ncbi:MAG: OsmC family protein [Thermoanaerobaculales bacterium]|nr:OsmC family protein [Thermoanaerobaculales bacterium]